MPSAGKTPASQLTDFRRRHPLNTIEAITEILKREGVEYLPCFPTTPVIEAAALGGIRPIICRQERVGVGIADGISRVSNGDKMGVFAMQYGPGAENAYPVSLPRIQTRCLSYFYHWAIPVTEQVLTRITVLSRAMTTSQRP